jgi:hypothetical protein
MAKTFSAQIDEAILKCNIRLTKLVRESAQDVIEEAQTPVGKGGKMRVKTGFLRASGRASLTGMPSGPTRGEPTGTYGSPDKYSSESSLVLALAEMKVGSTLYFGWTANYAQVRNLYDGFLDSAVQNWPKYVARNAERLMKDVK